MTAAAIAQVLSPSSQSPGHGLTPPDGDTYYHPGYNFLLYISGHIGFKSKKEKSKCNNEGLTEEIIIKELQKERDARKQLKTCKEKLYKEQKRSYSVK
ncbi:hypothetical protein AVEN_126681-1 [Araneus ventricosus]|uniref:Uncharacterized protein n=1 Tax=Araneus ventricosus TaxID=182803 RepID=A0A4Y2ICF4_ARAVE|nr:hypothetical protein AVEN_126681-1 [Araneus ventricosus]